MSRSRPYARRVPLLRRTNSQQAATATDATAEVDESQPKGKGRPTPKRSEARKARRQPVPRTRKEAEKLRRDRTREQRRQQRQALMTGDERHLPPRDAGPARRLARDFVDSRFALGQFALVLILVLFLLSASGNALLGLIVRVGLLIVALIFVAQGWWLGRQAQRKVIEVHGAEAARGIPSYVFMRAMSARRMRRPPPQVKRGAKV